MQLQVKLQKEVKLTYLEGENLQTVPPDMFRCFKERKKGQLKF